MKMLIHRCTLTEQTLSQSNATWNLEHVYIFLSSHTLLAQRDKIVREDPRVV